MAAVFLLQKESAMHTTQNYTNSISTQKNTPEMIKYYVRQKFPNCFRLLTSSPLQYGNLADIIFNPV